MNLVIHATLPGSEFSLTSNFNLLPFDALLNQLFSRLEKPQLEHAGPISIQPRFSISVRSEIGQEVEDV